MVNVAFSPRLWHLRVCCAGLNGAYHILTVLGGKRAMTLPWKGRNKKEIFFFSPIFGSPVSHTLGVKRQTITLSKPLMLVKKNLVPVLCKLG